MELASRYEQEGADEVVFLDISASAEERATLWDVARRTAERLFIPLTIGGGVRSAVRRPRADPIAPPKPRCARSSGDSFRIMA